jgi:ADP-ribose pyrophosphatase YjhB (NUDIX family)
MNSVRISARAIVLQDGKVLCVRQHYRKRPGRTPNDYWNLPGGGLEAGESLEACLAREMIEETGVAATIGNLMYIQRFAFEGTEFLEFFFHVTNADDFATIDLTQTSHGQDEIAEIAFIDPATANILPEFLATEPLETQTAAPAKLFSYL